MLRHNRKVSEPSAEQVLEVKKDFIAFRTDRDILLSVVFPARVHVSLVESMEPFENDIGPHVAFSPVGSEVVYKALKTEFDACTGEITL